MVYHNARRDERAQQGVFEEMWAAKGWPKFYQSTQGPLMHAWRPEVCLGGGLIPTRSVQNRLQCGLRFDPDSFTRNHLLLIFAAGQASAPHQ